MPALLTFSNSVEQDPAIAHWLDHQPVELRAVSSHWFRRVRECGNDVREMMHDGLATVCVQAAPYAYVGAFAAHVNIGFFHGDALADPENLLEGTGKYTRLVRLKPGKFINALALEALIDASYRDFLTRLRARDKATHAIEDAATRPSEESL